jgi:hypothetical protein
VVPFPLETIVAADVADIDGVVIIVVDVAVGFPSNLKKLKDEMSVLWVWIRMDPH